MDFVTFVFLQFFSYSQCPSQGSWYLFCSSKGRDDVVADSIVTSVTTFSYVLYFLYFVSFHFLSQRMQFVMLSKHETVSIMSLCRRKQWNNMFDAFLIFLLFVKTCSPCFIPSKKSCHSSVTGTAFIVSCTLCLEILFWTEK